jgi:hypothetical protein
MSVDQLLTLLVLVCVVAALILDKARADVVALTGAAFLLMTGVVRPVEVQGAFANSAVDPDRRGHSWVGRRLRLLLGRRSFALPMAGGESEHCDKRGAGRQPFDPLRHSAVVPEAKQGGECSLAVAHEGPGR